MTQPQAEMMDLYRASLKSADFLRIIAAVQPAA
jgi:hypothetical protein